MTARRVFFGSNDGKLWMRGTDKPVMLRPCDRDIWLDDAELIGDVLARQLGIDRVDRNAQAVERQPDPEEFRPILQQQRDARPAPVARGRKALAYRLNLAQYVA